MSLCFYMQRFSVPEIYKSDMFPGMERECMEKLLALGIPYLFFSVVTWGLKSEFKGEVNVPVGNLTQTLW